MHVSSTLLEDGKDGNCLNSFSETNINLISKLNEDITKKGV